MATNTKVRSLILFYLAPEFTMLAFTAALEVLRLANQVTHDLVYEWRIVSADGKPVQASCGLSLNPDLSLAEARTLVASARVPRMTVVCAGRNVQHYREKNLDKWLRDCRKRGVAVAAICTGPYLLAQAGLLSGKRCTIHWENYPAFVENFADAAPSGQIFEVDDDIYTSAGGTASLDMMLHIVAQDHGADVAREICQQAIVGAIRPKFEPQRVPFSLKQDVHNEIVKSAIQLMQEHLAEALSLCAIARRSGLSRRQLERLFRSELDCSPSRYYLRLRVEHAKGLVLYTGMSIVEVAIACGFVSPSHFSKVYRELEGESPVEARRLRRTTSDFALGPAIAA